MNNEENALSKKYTLRTLIGFAVPTMIMMLFNALYTGVDAIFVSRYVNTDALSAINIVMPVTSILWGLGTMFATGGSALIAKKMGEKNDKEARHNFTAIIVVGCLLGVLLAILGTVFLDEIITALGANENVLPYGRTYMGLLIWFAPAILIQVLFQNLFVTAGKPEMGLIVMIGAGVANLVLDFLFIAVLNMGILGAALGTGVGYCISTVAGLVLFSQRKGTLHFSKPQITLRELGLCCYNGSSEMVTQLATAITMFILNITMMRYAGADGVAAATIVGNTQYLFTTLVLGFSMGVAPIISYQFGAQNRSELRRIIKLCLFYVVAISVVLFAVCALTAPMISGLYTERGSEAYEIAVNGFRIFTFSFLFSGIAVFTSAMFTALSNGKISAILSFVRTFALLTVFLLVLPRILGVNGIWLATPLADFIGALLAISLLAASRKKYFDV
ncbi:MATE family efflux transporter [Enterococcus sp. 669A]|uniref:Multidrug export protein MepA n=1 Tax=Candidatus Enterococcus moelleringii TaxID=2815325 RepID=A0ABS3LDE4_9ENTE|nr:MATE family efflux transporter [Enterococcus sp. 669A]MBO1307648.1 MATE family efflux transporter [Enterococcus sp. 669A]